MILDLREAATRLGISPETVRRWARQGVLGMRLPGGDLRFEEDELKVWAKNQGLRFRSEAAPRRPVEDESGNRPLTGALRRGGIHPLFEGETPAEVLGLMVQVLPLKNPDSGKALLDQLLAREELSSTGLGHGIAIPHPRTPSRSFAEEPTVMLALLRKPVDWNALDGKPVESVMLLLNPDPQRHLRILSRVSYLLRESEFTSLLHSDSDPENLFAAVTSFEPE